MLRKGRGSLYKAPTKQEQRRKEESKRLRGERGQRNFIGLRSERWQVVRFRETRKGKMFHKLHVLGMNDHLWEKVRVSGSETWKGCE